ncbi:MAG TPA: glycoside hydrolase family 125 protein [Acidobacteriaceae bacterium]
MNDLWSRRRVLTGSAAVAASSVFPRSLRAFTRENTFDPSKGRPAQRNFTSKGVEQEIARVAPLIADPLVAKMFEQCFPNTLDTTVFTGDYEGKPDSYVITGDIDALWLRDSSAQVWPYLPFAKDDAELQRMLHGLIRRHARMVLLDPYANSFMRDTDAKPLSWAVHDHTDMKPGVGERKWEIDSLCYVLRLSHGYWKATGDTAPFDDTWRASARTIVKTFREQQRKNSRGPYHFQRSSPNPSDTVPLSGYGNPAKPNGLIYSMFRPSDDSCIYPLFIPANMFAVVQLRNLAEMAREVLHDNELAADATSLANEVDAAIKTHAVVHDPHFGAVYAYEIDGFGNTLLMDDANVPSLLALPYLGYCKPTDPIYRNTRRMVLSASNPYFFQGKAAEGIGGPHIGLDFIWPMSLLIRGLTSTDENEVRYCLKTLRDTTANTGFMHEAFHKDDPKNFTRPWFGWANTLFGEFVIHIQKTYPKVLTVTL